ncbi:toll/interleukin-1 receptor domain-containing protein [Leptospira perdikensis]|uniref:TIR domain-containing protein n=1 Tax=Leptospira perdikensis TaxID=2484948 RepID=A0A4R9JA73_9LEPT|nr:toll/interleukin-1 receptor domain-containing protein [Leptospira perdikensis]TGL35943.1 TIR domain-containing protein [Leptospira perdikensis]
MNEQNKKVFISYSHDSEELMDKILRLSNKFRSQGINSIIDQYEESPSEGWPRWMEDQIVNSEFILIVATEAYFLKPKSPSIDFGKGVTWESSLIYQLIYNNKSRNEKIIPIVFEDTHLKFIPLPIQGQTAYNVSNPNEYEKLYWRIRGIKKTEKPPLGDLLPLEEKERKSAILTTFIDVELWNEANWNGTVFLYDKKMELPPVLGLRFQSKQAAEKIFSTWIKRIGSVDKKEQIRISIIDGPLTYNPHGYTVHINSNVENILKLNKESKLEFPMEYFITIGRFNRMNPNPNSTNLSDFLRQYSKFNAFYLAPVYDEGTEQNLIPNLMIKKQELIYRLSKDIPRSNDLDSVVLSDNPG